jgi:predicted CXXCH cytochrome family protein
MRGIILLAIGIVSLIFPLPAGAISGIVNTRHNLSASGPGEIKALPGADPLDRICVFCHTPHNAAPRTPLWNKAIEPVNYMLYSSTTMTKGVTPSQPTGPSRLCLSCHDGTLAVGSVLRPVGGIPTTERIVPGRPSYLGVVLSGDHPFSFSYSNSTANPLAGLSFALPSGLLFYSGGIIHCSTCHDAHEDAYKSAGRDGIPTGKFLVADNRYSALCVKCHSNIEGWPVATHRTATNLRSLAGVLPVPPKKWPAWDTVAEWGCESCHTTHSAAGKQRLLYYPEEEKGCYLCHDGTVTLKNIKGQVQKVSSHPMEKAMNLHDPLESPDSITNRHAECVDCHNPHAANGTPASAPLVSGRVGKVSGMTAGKSPVYPSVNEYEICFKCHADLASKVPFIPRVVDSTNTRLEFSTSNPSYHPVVGIGRNPDVPSIPSTSEPSLTASSIIYCTACHGDDNGVSRGPHGSSYPPILRDRYETTDGTRESATAYALCYRCHDRTSILGNQSFRQHSKHLEIGATCSACHDPHGIDSTADDGLSGSHTHLINFDTRIVFPVPPNTKPVFTDTIRFSGSCTLVCHGETHDNLSYSIASPATLRPKKALSPKPLSPKPLSPNPVPPKSITPKR